MAENKKYVIYKHTSPSGKIKSIHRRYIIHRKYHDKDNKKPIATDSR